MEHPTRRPRLLLSAYACNPNQGSEKAVGWNRAVQAARHCDTWVLCEKHRSEADIRRYLETKGDIAGLHFEYIPGLPIGCRAHRITGMYHVTYNLWQRRALAVARRLHAVIGFDLVHHLTFCGYREPGQLWQLDIPFIWGPVGGTQNYPWRFLPRAGVAGAVTEGGRGLLNNMQFRFSSRVRSAARRAAVVITANSTGYRDFQRVHQAKPLEMSDGGVQEIAPARTSVRVRSEPLRILWAGRFIHCKAMHLLFNALRHMPDSIKYELRIVGKGHLETRCRRLARRSARNGRCEWMGWKSRPEMMAQYEWADVFTFTSLRDTTGTVVLEALSRGVPVICFDKNGAGDIVTNKCGVKIPVTTPQSAVEGLRDSLVMLHDDRPKLERLSRGALIRAEEFLWTQQGERMGEIYRELSQKSGRAK